MKRAVFSRVTAMALMAWLVAMLGTGSAQEWVKLREESANFYDIQRSFYKEWERRRLEERTPDKETFEDQGKPAGYTHFKRWEYDIEPRVYPSGILPEPDQNARAFQDYLQKRGVRLTGAATPVIPAANWTSLGPTAWTRTAGSVAPGLGRISAIAFHPAKKDIIFLGTPAGGLWKSTDAGATWSTNTDTLHVLGVSSIVINPSNPDIMYIATGDNDESHTQSIGVLKSTNGGASWDTTGLNWEVKQSRRIYKLIMHPANSNILLAATSNGLYKSTDAGKTWLQKMTSSWKDIEFKPGDPMVIYAVTNTLFYKSTNTGETWTQITNGVPATGSNAIGVNRLNIGVSAAKANYVYVLASRSDNSGFFGMYRSTDSGASFTVQSLDTSKVNTTPNILGYETNGSDAGGQGDYDLALVVSPTDTNELYTGGVNIWKSNDGGVNWVNKTYWQYDVSPSPAAYVHADVHLFEFNGSTLYTGTDGGFFKSTNGGTTWTDLSAGMNTTQYYRIGSYAGSANLVYGGAQDNTITRYTGGTVWESFLSGDGGECIVDPTNSKIVYISLQEGILKRSTDSSKSFTSIKPAETGAWVTPYVMHPATPTTLYAGYENVWKSIDSGSSWQKFTNYPVAADPKQAITISELRVAPSNVAPSNPDYVYYIRSKVVYRTIDGGATWQNITNNLPTAAFTQIAVADNDPKKIWITLSGYFSGNKVYASINGGDTWTNYSGTLTNLPFNTIVYHNNGGIDALYAGADVGVYYRDATMSDWELYQTGLPNVPIKELEVHENSGMLRAATFGRGLWQTPLVPPRGAALAFDGVDDYVVSNVLSTATTNITMEAWVKWAGLQGDGRFQVIFQNSYGIMLEPYDSLIVLTPGIGTQPGGHYKKISFPVDTWTHLALVGSDTELTLYMNGSILLVDNIILPASVATYRNQSSIGALIPFDSPLPAAGFFKGTIDEVRFWNVARSQAEIQATMNCELTGREPNLVAYYKFNQGIAGGNNAGVTTLMDFAGGQHNGTLNNFALTGTTSNWVAPGGVQSGATCTPVPTILATVTINKLLSASISGDDRVLPGSMHVYTVTTNARNPSYRWTVTHGTIIGNNEQSSVKVEAGGPEAPLEVEVSITDGVTNAVTHAVKSVTVTNPFALTANAGVDRHIILGTSTTLGGSPTATGGIPPLVHQWSPTTGLNNPNVANPIAQVTSNTTYTLTLTDGRNTVATDQVIVTTKANLALNKRARASSARSAHLPSSAVDGSTSRHWQSGVMSSGTNAWWRVDLGVIYNIDNVVIDWADSSYAKQYKIQVSNNPASGAWRTVYTDTAGNGGIDNITFPPIARRYVRILMQKHNAPIERINEVYVGTMGPVAAESGRRK